MSPYNIPILRKFLRKLAACPLEGFPPTGILGSATGGDTRVTLQICLTDTGAHVHISLVFIWN